MLRAWLKTAEREKRLKKKKKIDERIWRREKFSGRLLRAEAAIFSLFFFSSFLRSIDPDRRIVWKLKEKYKLDFLNRLPISLRFVYLETKIFAQFVNFLFQATLYPPFVFSLSLLLTFLLS